MFDFLKTFTWMFVQKKNKKTRANNKQKNNILAVCKFLQKQNFYVAVLQLSFSRQWV